MPLSPFDLLILALATLYLSYALTKTHGPFNVFEQVRARLPLGGLTNCMVCASLWIGAAFVGLWLISAQVIVYVFAIAGAAVFLAQYSGLKQE